MHGLDSMLALFYHYVLSDPCVGTYVYLCVCEEEDCVLSIHSSHLIQFLQVLMERFVVVASSEFNLEALVRADVSSQSSQTLLACASHPHQKGITSGLTNHACNPVKVHM